MTKSTSAGVRAAHAALHEAARTGRGVPLRLLLDIVTTVGGVSEGSAYMALRARIAPRSQYRAEGNRRWPEHVIITGSSQASQVWQLGAERAAKAG